MATCRDVLREAVEAFEGIAAGDDLTVDEIAKGLVSIQREVRRIHQGRGPLTDVDVTAAYTAGENERVRVQDGYTVLVTLPNLIATDLGNRNDYGFASTLPPSGSSAVGGSDTSWRAPRDGTRIEIVGTTQELWFYRSDLNEWVDANALTIDSDMPLNADYLMDFAAIISVRLCKTWPARVSLVPTAQMLREAGQANARLLIQPGRVRAALAAEFF